MDSDTLLAGVIWYVAFLFSTTRNEAYAFTQALYRGPRYAEWILCG